METIIKGLVFAGLFFVGSAMAAEQAASAVPATQKTTKITPRPSAKPSLSVPIPEVGRKNNCTACHTVFRRIVGPSFLDISKKYKGIKTYSYAGKDYPLMEGLMMKVSKGGAGSFGAMPMPPNDASGTKQAEIKEMVSFILGVEKTVTDYAKAAEEAVKPEAKK